MGGFGRKTLAIVQDQIDLYLYMNFKTNRWDSCCSEVFLRVMGGGICDGEGGSYSYGPEDGPKNQKGVLVARDEGLLKSML